MPHLAGFRGVVFDPSGAGERDATRALYRYHQRFPGPGRTFERKHLIAAIALSPYAEGAVRPHEATREAERAAALAAVTRDRGYAQPVLLGFRDPATEVDRLFRKIEGGRPTVEQTTPDGVVHRLWRVQDAELLGKLRHYFAPRKLSLLEGTERYEAALAYRDQLAGPRGLAQYSSANYVSACLVNLEDPTLVTAPRHRVLRGALELERVLEVARAHFIVEKLPGSARDLAKQFAALRETVAHQPGFVIVFAGTPDAYKLTLSPDVSPFSEGAAPHRALQKLDPVVVDNLFLARATPGAEVTTELDVEAALAMLDVGAAALLVMRPLSVEQVRHVEELGLLLPPRSTAFHPPLPPGLVAMPIDVDEDLV